MLISLLPFAMILTGMIAFGFYDKAKYRAAHPEEFPDAKKKKA
jgi:hypothetical protein